MKQPLNEHGQRRVAKAYCKLIAPLREVARKHGYAIGVHGSIKRDIDLIACPWTEDASAAAVLADAILVETERIIGFAVYGGDETTWPRTDKPHGRLCWTIHFNGTYIDLSVMPRITS